MVIRKHKSERDIAFQASQNATSREYSSIGRRSVGDRLETFRGRFSSTISVDNDRENDGSRQVDSRSRKSSLDLRSHSAIRAVSPLPNFTLLDLPRDVIDQVVEGKSEFPVDKNDAKSRKSFNKIRPSFDRTRSQKVSTGEEPEKVLQSINLKPFIANRSSILQRADDAISPEKKNQESDMKIDSKVVPSRNQKNSISKSIVPIEDRLTPSTERDNVTGRTEGGIMEQYTPDELRKASRWALFKTDIIIIPLMALVVMLQYLDKAIFSYAALLGLTVDLHITMDQYSFAASIYYIGMISGLPVWTFVLQSISADISTGITVTLWGMLTMTHAATKNYSGILAVRFFLGFLESSVTPALVLITSMFYTPKETISRTAIWYSFNGVALILGGGLSYGLLTNPLINKSSLPVWRILYLILGGVTIFVGICLFVFMPNHPKRTRLYTRIQRRAVMRRLQTQQPIAKNLNVSTIQQDGNIIPEEEDMKPESRPYIKQIQKTDWLQWLEAFSDIRLYLFFVGLLVGSIPNGGVTAYSTQLLSGFGFSKLETLLVSIAPGGGQILSVLLFISTALVTKSRILGANLLLFIAIAGSTMMYVNTTGRTAKTVGYVLLNFGSPAVVALYSFIGSAVLGHEKRVIFTIVAQLAYAIGNITGPLVFLGNEMTENYPTAKKVIIGSLSGAAFTLFCIGLVHAIWNYRRNLHSNQIEIEQQRRQVRSYENLSDFKRKEFRYVY